VLKLTEFNAAVGTTVYTRLFMLSVAMCDVAIISLSAIIKFTLQRSCYVLVHASAG
jgi:hypothetical protein